MRLRCPKSSLHAFMEREGTSAHRDHTRRRLQHAKGASADTETAREVGHVQDGGRGVLKGGQTCSLVSLQAASSGRATSRRAARIRRRGRSSQLTMNRWEVCVHRRPLHLHLIAAGPGSPFAVWSLSVRGFFGPCRRAFPCKYPTSPPFPFHRWGWPLIYGGGCQASRASSDKLRQLTSRYDLWALLAVGRTCRNLLSRLRRALSLVLLRRFMRWVLRIAGVAGCGLRAAIQDEPV
ncbi:hypothetical protein C8R43DRAFT_642391 [Mycena crocata]|nr:hypothetical protein C8R43DRAFT_642391 [Mycena crocata]